MEKDGSLISGALRVAAFALVAMLVAWLAWLMLRPAPVRVRVQAVETGVVERSVANTRAGTVKACRRALLAPMSGGRVAVVAVHEGDIVTEGQLLLELWNEDLKAERALAAAERAEALAQVAERCPLARLAERESSRRQKILARQQAISVEAVDEAEALAESKSAACRRAEAGVAAADARVARADAAVTRTQVRAPFAGVVAEVSAELGEVTTPSPPGIPTLPPIDLIDRSCLYVAAPIDEVDAPQVQVGQPLRVSLDAFPGQKFAATVRRVAPYVLEKEKQSRTVEVEAELSGDALSEALKPGFSADIEILLETHPAVLRVPTRAVLEGNRVLLLDGDELVERAFTPGLTNWDVTEVRTGLAAGERVVLSTGEEGVRAGARAVALP